MSECALAISPATPILQNKPGSLAAPSDVGFGELQRSWPEKEKPGRPTVSRCGLVHQRIVRFGLLTLGLSLEKKVAAQAPSTCVDPEAYVLQQELCHLALHWTSINTRMSQGQSNGLAQSLLPT